MLAIVEQRIAASEKKVMDKLEQQHTTALNEMAELRRLLVSKNDAIAASIQALSGLLGVYQSSEGGASLEGVL